MERPNLFRMFENAENFFKTYDTDFTKEKIVLITGDNASGKSLLRRVIQGRCSTENILCMQLSHERRVTPDISRAFLYGGEDFESTGQITARSITTLIRSAKDYDVPHVILIDEPEIGLGEEAQLGMAQYLKEKLPILGDKTIQIIIITHSRYIVQHISELSHIYFHVGGKYKSVNEYLNRKITSISPSMLEDIARANSSIIGNLMSEAKKRKENKDVTT